MQAAVERRFIAYYPGNGGLRVHVDAVHAAPPNEDKFTEEIATAVAARTGCACMVAKASRDEVNLNREPDPLDPLSVEAMKEYRDVIKDALLACGVLDGETGQVLAPYLHLGIHGMADRHYGPHAIEIGTRRGMSCSGAVSNWFLRKARYLAGGYLPPGTEVIPDRCFVGGKAIVCHRLGDRIGHVGYGPNYNVVQLEISRVLREEYREGVVSLLSALVEDFGRAFRA